MSPKLVKNRDYAMPVGGDHIPETLNRKLGSRGGFAGQDR